MNWWQWTLSLCVIVLFLCAAKGWQRPRVVREAHRAAYRRGLVHGARRERRQFTFQKKIELLNAQRVADARPDAGPPARVTPISIRRQKNT